MANKTVLVRNRALEGLSGLVLVMYHPETGAVVNGSGAGTNLTEVDNGLQSCVIVEALTGWFWVDILEAGIPILQNGIVTFNYDVEGSYFVDGPTVNTIEPPASSSVTGDLSNLATAMTTLGPQRVKTKDVEVEQHDILKLQKVMERNTVRQPTLASLHFVVAQPKCEPTPKENPCGDCCDME